MSEKPSRLASSINSGVRGLESKIFSILMMFTNFSMNHISKSVFLIRVAKKGGQFDTV